MKHSKSARLILSAMVLLTGCAAPTAGPTPSGPAGPDVEAPSKTLVVAIRAEPPTLSRRGLRTLGLTADLSPRIFNADLSVRNDQGIPVPYLAEAIPQLNTDTWRVNPDGTMETRYRLKQAAKWHDGTNLTADDFVFSFSLYSNPVFGLNGATPISLISRVEAPEPKQLVIHWKQTFPEADGGGQTVVLNPLPRHILGEKLATQDPEAFIANAFWTREYVGAGPYKLEQWEPGSFLEAVAFDGDVFGKPKIPRIREVIIGDPNTALANVLAGQAGLTSGDSIRFTDGETLRERWGDKGRVLNFPNLYRIVQFQRKPEFASTMAFTDLRVRQALSHGWDFQAVNDTVQGGRAERALGPIPPNTGYYDRLKREVPAYTYDARRVEQLMLEAGFAKGADGVWVHPNPQFGRMSFETNVLANPDSENEMHIMADNWRKLGFDVREVVWAASIGQDTTTRATFPGLSTTSTGFGENDFGTYRSDRQPTEARRWQGSNRGNWAGSPQYDRLVDIYETSLNREERTEALIGLNKIYMGEAIVIPLYFKLNAVAAINGLVGPRVVDPTSVPEWNIHEWENK